jgi:HSP20 family protein
MRRRDDIDRLHDEIRELVDDLWHLPRFAGGRRGFRPPVDCVRSEDPPALHVVVELAGVDPTSIKVVVADRVLVVAGERRRPPLSGRYRQLEIEYGAFQRKVVLSQDVDPERATATYERGILRVVLPVAPKPAPSESVSIHVRTQR